MFPLPSFTRILVFFCISVLPFFSIIPFRRRKALLDVFDLLLRRRGAFLGFLLKGLRHVDSARKADCIDGPEGVALMGYYDL
jgi:hypothetical protein